MAGPEHETLPGSAHGGGIAPAPPAARLEFSLPPEDLPRLVRLPGLLRSGRTARVDLAWHDTADGALAARNRSLCGLGPTEPWRLEALHPSPALFWPPAGPPPLLAEAAETALAPSLPGPVHAIASFRGCRHSFANLDADQQPGPVEVVVHEGHLRGPATIRPLCRVQLAGPPGAVAEQVAALGAAVRLAVPRAGLAAEAVALAQGTEPPPGHLGLPQVSPGQPLSTAIALVMGSLVGVMLHWAVTAGDGNSPVPVHQMRVATRRLRSALSIFKHPAACPQTAPLGAALRVTAAQLGAARDWDVFLTGIGAQVLETFPDDPRLAALMAAGQRRRAKAYAALRDHLGGAAFRTVSLSLACAANLRPWDGLDPAQDHVLQADATGFAAEVLARRLHRVRRAGRGLRHLPVPALHELRKDCKRLRYAAEFFTPLFPAKPGRRFLRHLGALQEALGLLNDGAATAGLMAQLGRTGEGYAAGLVNGFVAGGSGATRAAVRQAWHDFRHADPFWAQG
jgi:triphosphatase